MDREPLTWNARLGKQCQEWRIFPTGEDQPLETGLLAAVGPGFGGVLAGQWPPDWAQWRCVTCSSRPRTQGVSVSLSRCRSAPGGGVWSSRLRYRRDLAAWIKLRLFAAMVVQINTELGLLVFPRRLALLAFSLFLTKDVPPWATITWTSLKASRVGDESPPRQPSPSHRQFCNDHVHASRPLNMKRAPEETPTPSTHQWGRPPPTPLPCLPCQQQKRRCDRGQPCSNCRQWNLSCEYPDQTPPSQFLDDVPPSPSIRSKLRRLDEASARSGRSDLATQLIEDRRRGETGLLEIRFTRFNSHSPPGPSPGLPSDAPSLAAYLPPRNEARVLIEHAARAPSAPIRILHVPSVQALIEQTYQGMLDGHFPDHTKLLLFFALFGLATLDATHALWPTLNTTNDQATAALRTYTQLGCFIGARPEVQPSTNALAALWILHRLCTNESGHSVEAHLLRARGILMARTMQIQWLDTPKAREERKLMPCDVVELEVKRRLWWMMVATDWVVSYSTGPQGGTYLFHPKHMCVHLPTNADDENITPGGILHVQPLTEPTGVVGILHRVVFATLCRETVDALPYAMLQGIEPDYNVIVGLDARWQEYLKGLPTFYQLDPESIRQSEKICAQRPYIAFQRTTANVAAHTRLCQLHRPYHLRALTNQKYLPSRQACVRSAQALLNLRRLMDKEESSLPGQTPNTFRVAVPHLIMAALTLAADTFFNPSAPDADAREAKILTAFDILENSTEDSCGFRLNNLRTLMAMLGTRQPPTLPWPHNSLASPDGSYPSRRGTPLEQQTFDSVLFRGIGQEMLNERGPWSQNWPQLWSEFLVVAPELDLTYWDILFDGPEAV
ncbi:hypothetical protein BJY00DRAFT_210555 [Aspergillus carlsbadensis]|nr:hypothetical protein BJY00DRAFT_210555 [Aspergillus carlsbadensis]